MIRLELTEEEVAYVMLSLGVTTARVDELRGNPEVREKLLAVASRIASQQQPTEGEHG